MFKLVTFSVNKKV
jgi:hypothetical protein